MDWILIGETNDGDNVFINYDRGIIAFDGQDTPSIDAEQMEYEDLEDVINILTSNNVSCFA